MMSSNYYDRLFIITVIPLVLAAALICLHIKFGRSEERQGGTNVFSDPFEPHVHSAAVGVVGHSYDIQM